MTNKPPFSIAMTGASGFVGTHLKRDLENLGWEIVPITRGDIQQGVEHLARRINGVNAVINLAGAPIAKKWTPQYKKILRASRVDLTHTLVDAFSQMKKKPGLFISTSAIGFYADGGPYTEEDFVQDKGFLGNLAEDWEHEANKASELGIRTVVLRFGVVLGKDGGAMQKMLLPFKLGLGGKIGDGQQPFSWVHIKDLERVYISVINDPKFQGTYNLTAPNPVTNATMTKLLAQTLSRPAFLTVPSFLLKMQLGEGAKILTNGQQVIPKKLLDSGFTFQFTDLKKALEDCLD